MPENPNVATEFKPETYPAGLSDVEAASRITRYGFNELPSSKPRSIFRIAFEVIREPMLLLLVACGSTYLLLGDVQEAIILLIFVFVVIAITITHARTKMNKDRIEGSVEQAKGKVKEVAGKVTGDSKLENEGKAQQVAGKVQNTVGGLKDTVKEAVDD